MASATGMVPIGVFYDGNYFQHVSRYYAFDHPVRSRIAPEGLQSFIARRVAELLGRDIGFCRITEAHYFRGRLWTDEAVEKDCLESERRTEDYLMKARITPHSLPLRHGAEKGVDVSFALEAYERASRGAFSVAVLVTGDGDYLPLVKKLGSLGVIAVVASWDLPEGSANSAIYGSAVLRKEAPFALDMAAEMEDLLDGEDAVAREVFPLKEIQVSGDMGSYRFALDEGGEVVDSGNQSPDSIQDPLPDKGPVDGEKRANPMTAHSKENPSDNGTDQESGTVDYLHEKGYGFLRPHHKLDPTERLFFFKTDVENEHFDNLYSPQYVTFRRSRNERGPCAVEVRV